MPEPLVSVIIPTYNRSDFVQVAIDSVLEQTYKNFELIVIDDGSVDETKTILTKKYGDRLIYHWQENQGESASRNRGLSLARGKYVSFLDSDDFWHPDKLLHQVSAFEKVDQKSVAAVYSTVSVVDTEGKIINSPSRKHLYSRHKKVGLKSLFSGSRIFSPPSNLLIKKTCLEEINGFDSQIHYGEDWDLLIRLRSKWKFIFVDRPLIFYRSHTTNQQNSLNDTEKIKAILSDHLRVLQKNAESLGFNDSKFITKAIVKEYEKAAYQCYAIEKWAPGTEYLLHATAVNKKSLPPNQLASNISLGSVKNILEKGCTIQTAEEYLHTTLLPSLEKNWNPLIGIFRQNKIAGWYYHNLAFLSGNVFSEHQGYLCKKSISYEQHFLTSFNTLKVIIQDYCRRHFRTRKSLNTSLF